MEIYEALVFATKDYSMDKRGDVGSWSRIAAMNGLEQILLAALKFDNSGDDSGAADSEAKFVTTTMVTEVVCAILKQLCEKLDNVRAKAGSVIERLISVDSPISQLVPNRVELEAILTSAPGEPAVNWALASETYPKMMKIVELPCYHDAVVSGLILSVGGLTEAVVKSSSKSLLDWAKAKKADKELEPLTKLSSVLLGLFNDNFGDDRVILPLMKSLELLLEAELFDFLCSDSPVFGVDLLAKVKKELHRTTNVVKLFTGLNIALSLLMFGDEIKKASMQLVLELLGHRYPRVRKHAAEQFYTKLFIDDRLVEPEVYDLVLDQLRFTVWDADIQSARQERNAIAAAVGVQLTEHATAPKKAKAKVQDELDSYQHLVNEVGY
jgi:tubulin-specific chaperone D